MISCLRPSQIDLLSQLVSLASRFNLSDYQYSSAPRINYSLISPQFLWPYDSSGIVFDKRCFQARDS